MLTFKSYDNKSVVRSRFEKMLTEMSIYDTKYPIGTEFSPSSTPDNLKKSNSVGLPLKKGDVLVKVQPTPDSKQVQIWKKFCENKCEFFINSFPSFFNISKEIGKQKTIDQFIIKGDIHYNLAGNEILYLDFVKIFKK